MCLSIKVNHPENVLSEGEHLGHQFVTVHNSLGYRCGYVRVPKGHPWHGKDYDSIAADAHGGLTFAEPDKECHGPGEDDAWWVGFDCAHLGDAPDPSLPNKDGYPRVSMFGGDTIKTQAYVEEECFRLCEQASQAGKGEA